MTIVVVVMVVVVVTVMNLLPFLIFCFQIFFSSQIFWEGAQFHAASV